MTTTIEQQLSKLPPGWSLWQCQAGIALQVQYDGEPAPRTISGESLAKLLEEAIEYKPLPTIPRRPEVLIESHWELVRTGGKWNLLRRHGGDELLIQVKTKRECEESLRRFCERTQKAAEEWETKHEAWLVGKVEGVDFRFGT